MNSDQKSVIKEHLPELCEQIDLHEVLTILHLKQILSEGNVENIENRTNAKLRAMELLNLLQKKDGAWDALISALIQAKQSFLADLLKNSLKLKRNSMPSPEKPVPVTDDEESSSFRFPFRSIGKEQKEPEVLPANVVENLRNKTRLKYGINLSTDDVAVVGPRGAGVSSIVEALLSHDELLSSPRAIPSFTEIYLELEPRPPQPGMIRVWDVGGFEKDLERLVAYDMLLIVPGETIGKLEIEICTNAFRWNKTFVAFLHSKSDERALKFWDLNLQEFRESDPKLQKELKNRFLSKTINEAMAQLPIWLQKKTFHFVINKNSLKKSEKKNENYEIFQMQEKELIKFIEENFQIIARRKSEIPNPH